MQPAKRRSAPPRSKPRRVHRVRPEVESLEDRSVPALFVVNTLADVVDPDPDVTSLREAILGANANAGADAITFHVAGQISLATQLPNLIDATGGTTINATTAPGYEGIPVVSLFGPGTTTGIRGLQIHSADNAVRGLQIGNFAVGIELHGATSADNVVEANYIGTDGSAAIPNQYGIQVIAGATGTRVGTDGDGISDGAEGNLISGNLLDGINAGSGGQTVIAGNRIGTDRTGTGAVPNNNGVRLASGFNLLGTDADGVSDDLERNLISGNSGFGVIVAGSSARNNDVMGNFIGTDRFGTAPLANGGGGAVISVGAVNNRIGSISPAQRNVISGNGGPSAGPFGNGILISDATTKFLNLVTNNAIGTDLTGTLDLGNSGQGIQITSGASTVQINQNVIAFNDSDGVRMNATAGSGVSILSNSFFNNGGLGINLVSPGDNSFGVSPTDALDADAGPNDLQNAPVLHSAVATGSSTSITYKIHTTPNTFVLFQFYRSSTADPSGFGEGKSVIAQRGLTTNGHGNATETFTTGILPVGERITALAFVGNTSEFSNAVPVAQSVAWTGGGRTANLSDPANWGGTAPSAGDHLVFGPGTPATVVNDFPADTEFSSLAFNGGEYFVTGNRIRIGAGGITVNGGDTYIEQDNQIDPIDLPIAVAPGSSLTLAGVVSGAGGLLKEGAGTLLLTNANTFAGATLISEGSLRIQHAQALGSAAAGVTVGEFGTLELAGGITVSGQTLTVAPGSRTTDIIAILIGHNIWDGAINAPNQIDPIDLPISTAPRGSLTITGVISGSANLIKEGAGSLNLEAANTFAGGTTINSGSLVVNGSLANRVTLNGGILRGDGTVAGARVQIGGIRPGNSPGVLTSTGDVEWFPGTTYGVELNGTAAGTDYDQFVVHGMVELGGANLDIALGFAPRAGDSFVILGNDGTDAVRGTFAGLPEGAVFGLEGNPYRITYAGGDGNDVELTRLGVGVVDGRLVVDGTSADDYIRVVVRGDSDCDDDDPARVTVRVNGRVIGRFALDSFQEIVVRGFAGDDHVHVSERITKPAYLFGDEGDDFLDAGGGNDVLIGGDGDDRLRAGKGRDLLIGGDGADQLRGQGQDDILIAGWTAFDRDATALHAIMAEWTRTDLGFSERVTNLRNGGGLNGSVVLNDQGADRTVFDDDDRDRLCGGSGSDLFFFDADLDDLNGQDDED